MASKFIRNSLFGIVAGFSTTFGNFISGLLVARLLGVELTGTVTFVIWLTNMLVTIFVAGIPPTLSRYLPELSSSDQDKTVLSGVLSYMFRPFISFALIPVVGLLIYAGWLTYTEIQNNTLSLDSNSLRNPTIYVIVAVCCGLQAVADYVKAYYRGLQQFDQLARTIIVSVLFQMTVIAVGGTYYGVEGVLIGYLIGNGLPSIYIAQVIKGNKNVEPELKSRIFRYARFRWAAEVMSAFVWSRIEVFFLIMWWGSGPVGLLTVGMTLANLAVQGPLMLTWGLLPRFTEQYGNNEISNMNNAYQTATRLMALLVFPACFGLAAIIPEILPLMFGQAFAPATNAAELLIFTAAIPAAATVGSNILWATDRSDLDFYSAVAGAAIAIICGITIIPAFGLMGAATARVITQLAVVGLVSWFMAKKLKMSMPFRDLGKLACAAILCAAAARASLLIVTGLTGVALAIFVGGITYAISLRIFKAIPIGDAEKIHSISNSFPPLIQRPVSFTLKLVTG